MKPCHFPASFPGLMEHIEQAVDSSTDDVTLTTLWTTGTKTDHFKIGNTCATIDVGRVDPLFFVQAKAESIGQSREHILKLAIVACVRSKRKMFTTFVIMIITKQLNSRLYHLQSIPL